MAKLLVELFELFAAETGILGEVRPYEALGIALLGVLAVLACFLGIRSFHLTTAAWMYMSVIFLSSLFFRERMTWGEVTVFFSVVGFVMAFLAYQWNLSGAVITTALIAAAFAALGGFSPLWIALCALLGGVLAFRYPGPALCGGTAVFGGVLLAGLLPVSRGWAILLALTFSAAGLGLQLLLARHDGLLSREGMKRR